jgi:hypothetical protein
VLKQELDEEQMVLAENIDVMIFGYGFSWKPICQEEGAPIWTAFNVNPVLRLQELEAGLSQAEREADKLPEWFVQMYPRPNFVSPVQSISNGRD